MQVSETFIKKTMFIFFKFLKENDLFETYINNVICYNDKFKSMLNSNKNQRNILDMYINFVLQAAYTSQSIYNNGVTFLKHSELSFTWSITKEQGDFWAKIYNKFTVYVKKYKDF